MSYVDKLTPSEKGEYSIVKKWDGKLTRHDKTIFQDSLIVNVGKVSAFILIDCYVQGDIEFVSGEITDVNIINCCIDGDIKFNGNINFKSLYIEGVSVGGNITLMKGEYGSFICDIVEANEVVFNGGTYQKLFCTFNKISFIDINLYLIKGDIELGYGVVDKLKLYGANIEVKVSIYDISVTDFFILDYRNDKGLRLFDVKPKGNETTFYINNSYLGKAEFHNINLSSFSQVFFTNTHLIDCSFVNTEWMSALSHEKQIEDAIFDVKETYRQLKYALSKQGDVINEQRFHTLELRTYYAGLRWRKAFWNKGIIFLSYYTSNFGQSIWWPIRALLVGHLFFFLIAMFADMASVHISFTNASWSALNTAIYEYFYLINPLHKTEDLPKDWTIIIDIFMRIWSSYMIYNIIRASRRFIK